jgi:IclR family KDG regulon transcriptional repressor
MSEPVRTVDRALDILLCFRQDEPVLSFTQIAERVSVPKSTVHRLLATLERKRFIIRDKTTGKYRLGLRFIETASLVLQDADLQRWTQLYLQRLSDECGETVDLAVLDETDVVYLQVIEGPQQVKLAARVGQQLPAFCTASGKAFLAYLPNGEVDRILGEGLPKCTENTPVSLTDLYEDLRVVRERGFAISEEEYEKDINAVAAPILDANGCPVAAVAIVGPSFRLPHERMLMLGQSIQVTTDAIAREVGLVGLSAIVSKSATPGFAGQNNIERKFR